MVETVREALLHEPYQKMPISFYSAGTCVSIKGVGHGIEGRAGATTKHRANHPKTLKAKRDAGHAIFRSQVGDDDAQAYLDLMK